MEIPYNLNGYSYSYSDALFDPKAILVDSEKQIFAFAISTYSYTLIDNVYQSKLSK